MLPATFSHQGFERGAGKVATFTQLPPDLVW
jgi:hypothetical protein